MRRGRSRRGCHKSDHRGARSSRARASRRLRVALMKIAVLGGGAFLLFFFFNDTATTEIYTPSLHDALPISRHAVRMGVEEKVLARIRPSAEEEARIERAVKDLLERLTRLLRSKGWEAKPFLAGSVAKGTHLTGTEIDLFVAFPPDLPRPELETRGLALGKILERGEHRYAEHPYTRGWHAGFEVEIVPCYRITDATQRMSAVDRTPLHVDYVLGRIKEGQAD